MILYESIFPFKRRRVRSILSKRPRIVCWQHCTFNCRCHREQIANIYHPSVFPFLTFGLNWATTLFFFVPDRAWWFTSPHPTVYELFIHVHAGLSSHPKCLYMDPTVESNPCSGLLWMDIFMLIPILAICWWKKVLRGAGRFVSVGLECIKLCCVHLYTSGVAPSQQSEWRIIWLP